MINNVTHNVNGKTKWVWLNSVKEEIITVITNPDDFKFNEDFYITATEIFHTYDEYFSEFLSICLQECMVTENFRKCLEISKLRLIYLKQHLNTYEMNIGGQEIQISKICIQLGK